MQYIHLLFTCAFVSTLSSQFPTVLNNIPKNKYQKGGKNNSFDNVPCQLHPSKFMVLIFKRLSMKNTKIFLTWK